MRVTLKQVRQIFGNPSPPTTIWQQQFDGEQAALEALTRMDWQKMTIPDLTIYIEDLVYVDLQPDLFRYLFPACLLCWHNTLMQNTGQGYVALEYFHRAVSKPQKWEKMVSQKQRKAVYEFFQDSFLDRMEAERGFIYNGSSTPAYEWIYRLNALGYMGPIIEPLWKDWWKFDHPGKAVSAMMYATGLIYLKGENPIFREWTPQEGGGGPYLSETEQIWLPENLEFLKNTLSVPYLQQKMREAAGVLKNELEGGIAAQISQDAANSDRADLIALHIQELLDSLAGY